MRIDRDKISAFILRLRTSRHLSQTELGKLLHVNERTVRNWEKGISLPSMEDIVNIVNEFNISLEELFEGELNTDKEISRKIGDVTNNLKSLNLKIDQNEKNLDLLSKRILHIQQVNSSKNDSDLLIGLLLLHVITACVSFLYFGMGTSNIYITCMSTIIYITGVTYILVKGKKKRCIQRSIIAYSVMLCANLFVNYTIFYKITIYLIVNPEVLLVNGPLYGLSICSPLDMTLLIRMSSFVYVIWTTLSLYYLYISKGQQENEIH